MTSSVDCPTLKGLVSPDHYAVSLARMQLLLTNDDGIDAPGIQALRRAVEMLGEPVVLAPSEPLSGCSHQATTHRPLALLRRADRQFALDGTPVDCARIGLGHLAPQTDWVLSGINEGGNLGADVYRSGTVAAVREAVLLGTPGVAISQYLASRHPVDWDRAARWSRTVLARLLAEPLPAATYWNVNLPDGPEVEACIERFGIDWVPPIVHCPLDPNPLPVRFEVQDDVFHFRARYQERQRTDGHDVALCFGGHITVTSLTLHLRA
ncbi:MAG: 5'/3'-nucleotidase SurE [Pirellulales bacterium]|nr:5'/3'-nucleotidase SurE [Pirellulales bacterium]